MPVKPGMTGPRYSIHLSFMLGWILHQPLHLGPFVPGFSSGKLTPWHLAIGVLFTYQVSARSSPRTLPNHLIGSRSPCSITVASLLVLFASQNVPHIAGSWCVCVYTIIHVYRHTHTCLLCCVRSVLKVLFTALCQALSALT